MMATGEGSNEKLGQLGSGEFRRRDAGMVRVMGGFFWGFAVLVLVGQFWPQGLAERVVNLVAGLALLAVGAGAMVVAARWGRSDRRG